MTLGIAPSIGSINLNDTAELYASLRINDQPVTEDQMAGVNFIVQLPDETIQTVGGDIQADGRGFLRWTATTLPGVYQVQAQFSLLSGEVRSVMLSFDVIDPFNLEPPNATDLIVEQVMLRLDDSFDSIEGGPWLKDKSHFDYQKIAAFIPEALLDINVQMPPTNFGIDMFTLSPDGVTPNPNMPILIKAVLVLMIRHLSRSYVEQPMPTGGQIVWNDRTRYTQMWAQVYQVEYQDYISALRLWKRTLLNLGHSALLTFSKSGRLFPYASQRSRGISRGYY